MPARIFKSKNDKKWYFHITGDNGEIIVPSQGYSRRDSASRGLNDLEHQILKDMVRRQEDARQKRNAHVEGM